MVRRPLHLWKCPSLSAETVPRPDQCFVSAQHVAAQHVSAPDGCLDQGPVGHPPVPRHRVEVEVVIQVVRAPLDLQQGGILSPLDVQQGCILSWSPLPHLPHNVGVFAICRAGLVAGPVLATWHQTRLLNCQVSLSQDSDEQVSVQCAQAASLE